MDGIIKAFERTGKKKKEEVRIFFFFAAHLIN
jgi:hypothetical protein